MTNFEQKLEKLEEISTNIKQSNISLEDALKNFEEGIKIAKILEKELDAMEGKIQILMNNPESIEQQETTASPSKGKKSSAKKSPGLELFDESSEITGTRS